MLKNLSIGIVINHQSRLTQISKEVCAQMKLPNFYPYQRLQCHKATNYKLIFKNELHFKGI